MDFDVNPLVSVLMPAFNAASFIGEAIESILDQTYQNWELLILNDASTDETIQVITSYSDDRIRIIHHKENKGVRISREELMFEANGNIVCWMDADDISYPRRLALQVKAFLDDPELVLCSGVADELIDNRLIENVHKSLTNEHLKVAMFFMFPFKNGTVAMKRSDALAAIKNSFTYRQAEDYVLYSDMMSRGKFLQLSEPLIKYRIHQGEFRITDDRNNLEIVRGRMVAWRNMLSMLDMEASDNVLMVHDKVCYYPDRLNDHDVVSIPVYTTLLCDMLKANRAVKVFDTNLFHNSISHQLYTVLLQPILGIKIGIRSFIKHLDCFKFLEAVKYLPNKVRRSIRPHVNYKTINTFT